MSEAEHWNQSKNCSLAVQTTPKGSCDGRRAGGPKNPCQREAIGRVRDTMDSRAKDMHALSEVSSNAGKDATTRKKAE